MNVSIVAMEQCCSCCGGAVPQTHIKNLLSGNHGRYIFRGILWGAPGKSQTESWNVVSMPAIILGQDGKRHWGMVRQGWPVTPEFQRVWALRDLQVRW